MDYCPQMCKKHRVDNTFSDILERRHLLSDVHKNMVSPRLEHCDWLSDQCHQDEVIVLTFCHAANCAGQLVER